MDISEFDYNLPKEAIAQEPLEKRDEAKLLVLDRKEGSFQTAVFRDLGDILSANDLLALNNTKVIPARLRCEKESGGKVEVFVLKEIGEGRAEALVRGRIKEGLRLKMPESEDRVEVEIEKRLSSGKYVVRFLSNPVKDVLKNYGKIPLPPYIKRPVEPKDRDYYQTVFAQKEGAVASPTAGLHFTPELLASLEKKKIDHIFITLHIGWGTFKPIRNSDVTKHQMEPEFFEILPKAAKTINERRENGCKITACGTTVVRTLEGTANNGKVMAGNGWVKIFIYPGYQFQIVDKMITNLHLPRTTPLLLTAAFAGKELLLESYRYAWKEGFRFGSYGDAMLII